jgi:SAM-dependent methyltransferase
MKSRKSSRAFSVIFSFLLLVFVTSRIVARDAVEGNETKNEKLYDATYWEFQKPMNQFGASFKGDILRHLIPNNAQSVLEFGCSGGYILSGLPDELAKHCIEINPEAAAHAETLDSLKGHVHARLPKNLKVDVIYSTSVLEHVDCPLCELVKLKFALKSAGVLLIGVKNDGFDPSQTFSKFQNEPNHHIYTWNELLLSNLLNSAGFIPCDTIGQLDAWHLPLTIEHYESDKHAYCEKGLQVGKEQNVYNIWSAAVLPGDEQLCPRLKAKLSSLKQCKYLEALVQEPSTSM